MGSIAAAFQAVYLGLIPVHRKVFAFGRLQSSLPKALESLFEEKN
jgi:hypothetical protein